MKYVCKLENVDCAHCASKIEKAVSGIKGIDNVNVSFFSEKLSFECDERLYDEMFEKVKEICRKVSPDSGLKKL